MTLPSRFWDKVEPSGECLIWQSSIGHKGYGKFWFKGGCKAAHVVAYTETVGPVPEGLQLDHTCENKACVNPDHLEPVTGLENMRRRYAKMTECKLGHLFTEENTIRQGDNGRWRRCRECARQVSKRYMRRKRATQNRT